MVQEGYCPICSRLHGEKDPCPQRIARAYLIVASHAFEELTEADNDWMIANPLNIVELLEEHLADRMDPISPRVPEDKP